MVCDEMIYRQNTHIFRNSSFRKSDGEDYCQKYFLINSLAVWAFSNMVMLNNTLHDDNRDKAQISTLRLTQSKLTYGPDTCNLLEQGLEPLKRRLNIETDKMFGLIGIWHYLNRCLK